MLHKENIEDINYNIRSIDKMLKVYGELLTIKQEPEIIELTAIASVLHSFYGGLESIFISVIKIKGANVPSGNSWHKEIVELLFSTTAFEKLVFPLSLKKTIVEYLTFRHLYRHSYSYILQWDKMDHLLINLQSNWKAIKTYLRKYLNEL